jgi:hypothetical protein
MELLLRWTFQSINQFVIGAVMPNEAAGPEKCFVHGVLAEVLTELPVSWHLNYQPDSRIEPQTLPEH